MEEKTNLPEVGGPEAVPGPVRREKLPRRERRRHWKEAKLSRRNERKEYYRYAPWGKRVWNLYLKKPVCVLLILGILAGLAAANMQTIFSRVVVPIVQSIASAPVDTDLTEAQLKRLYEQSPIDEDGAARIDAFPPADRDETWTICVYFVGSNLEDYGENDLSNLLYFETQEERSSISAEFLERKHAELDRFRSELEENGLTLPRFFYHPDSPVASVTPLTKEVIVTDKAGMASQDIAEMTAGQWSGNISVVFQTGGATRWSNAMVNPNRTQRFAYRDGELREVADLPLQPSASEETLAEFVRFCRDEYPSDHRILILWNHGGGPFGYGNDSIFGDMLSLKEIRSALESVYSPDSPKPAFDIIGFDACLMSTLEVTHALRGFADYFCLSEESEPGDGWDYTPWLQAMTEDPTLSPAQVARLIADTYTDHYMRANIVRPMFAQDVTFSVLDASRTEELYNAYCALAEIGRCAEGSTHYAGSSAYVYNMVDLGNYVDLTVDHYPEESSEIKRLIGEAVLYHRQNGALSDSTGIAVYIPANVSELNGLLYYLDYVYNVSDNDSVTALYYYKQAGCLSEELQKHVASLTDREPKILDVTPFREFSMAEPGFDSEGFLLPVSEELQNLIADYSLEIGRYDRKANRLIYYGRADALRLDGEGHMLSEFDGRWIYLNDVPLYTEVVSSSASAVKYRAHVNYDGKEAYLLISRDRDTDELNISGLHMVTDDMLDTRSHLEVTPGARIAPIYQVTDYSTLLTSTETGRKVTFTARTDLQLKPLPDGTYLSAAVISDQRGDVYYSPIFSSAMRRDAMENWQLLPGFYGRDY